MERSCSIDQNRRSLTSKARDERLRYAESPRTEAVVAAAAAVSIADCCPSFDSRMSFSSAIRLYFGGALTDVSRHNFGVH